MLEDVEKVDDLKLNFQVWNKKTKGKHHPKALLMIRKDAPPVGWVLYKTRTKIKNFVVAWLKKEKDIKEPCFCV